MITHEEAKKHVLHQDRLLNDFDLSTDGLDDILDYINYQKKKDELLHLYRKWFLVKTTKQQDDITNQIVKLEEELK